MQRRSLELVATAFLWRQTADIRGWTLIVKSAGPGVFDQASTPCFRRCLTAWTLLAPCGSKSISMSYLATALAEGFASDAMGEDSACPLGGMSSVGSAPAKPFGDKIAASKRRCASIRSRPSSVPPP